MVLFRERCISFTGFVIDGNMFCSSERYKMSSTLHTAHWHRTEHWHIGTLAPSNAALAKKGKWSPISKRLFDQIKVVTKGWQSFAEKKQNSSISPLRLPPLSLSSKLQKGNEQLHPKSVATKRRVDVTGMSPLGRDFSQPISDAGCLQPCRKWPLRDESAMQAGVSPRYETTRNGQLGRHSRQISNLSFPAPL